MAVNQKARKTNITKACLISIVLIGIILLLVNQAEKRKVELFYWDKLQTQLMEDYPQITAFNYTARIDRLFFPSYEMNISIEAKIDGDLTPELEKTIKNGIDNFLNPLIWHSQAKQNLTKEEENAQHNELTKVTGRPIFGINIDLKIHFKNAKGSNKKYMIKGSLWANGAAWDTKDIPI